MKFAAMKHFSLLLTVFVLASCGASRNSKNTKAIVSLEQTGASNLNPGTLDMSSLNSNTNLNESTATLSSTTSPVTSSTTQDSLVNINWNWIGDLFTPVPSTVITDTNIPPVDIRPTLLIDSILEANQWKEFTLANEAILIAKASVKFSYLNGGGGSAVIDLQQQTSSGWRNFVSIGHCGSDSVGSAIGPGSFEVASTQCLERLQAGQYRIKAGEGHFSTTTAYGFQAHVAVFNRIVPEQFNGVYSAGSLPNGTALFDSALIQNEWKEIVLSQKGILFSHALSSFNYQNGGGGTVAVDLQLFQNGIWVSFVNDGSSQCATNSYIQNVSSTTAVESTAICEEILSPGRYRIRASLQHYSNTGINYFRSGAVVIAL